MRGFDNLPKLLYFTGIGAKHPRSSANVSLEYVAHAECEGNGAQVIRTPTDIRVFNGLYGGVLNSFLHACSRSAIFIVVVRLDMNASGTISRGPVI